MRASWVALVVGTLTVVTFTSLLWIFVLPRQAPDQVRDAEWAWPRLVAIAWTLLFAAAGITIVVQGSGQEPWVPGQPWIYSMLVAGPLTVAVLNAAITRMRERTARLARMRRDPPGIAMPSRHLTSIGNVAVLAYLLANFVAGMAFVKEFLNSRASGLWKLPSLPAALGYAVVGAGLIYLLGQLAAQGQFKPRITALIPQTATPGSQITLYGENLPPRTSAQLSIGGVVTTATIGDNGDVIAHLPDSLSIGAHDLILFADGRPTRSPGPVNVVPDEPEAVPAEPTTPLSSLFRNAVDQVTSRATARRPQLRQEERTWNRAHYWVGVPAALLAGFGGVTGLTDVPTWLKITGSILAIIGSGLAAVATTLNAGRRAETAHAAQTNLQAIELEASILRHVDLPSNLSDAVAREALDQLESWLMEVDGLPPRPTLYRRRLERLSPLRTETGTETGDG
jgi:hypothetical protein